MTYKFSHSSISTVALCLMLGTAPAWAGGNPATNDNSNGSNTGGGTGALITNTGGTDNTAYGNDALRFNTSGWLNAAFGWDALRANTTGSYNTAAGSGALSSNTYGEGNTAVGDTALAANINGHDNTAVGANALDSNTSGGYNAALGENALIGNTTGIQNTAVGRAALVGNSTGSNNIAVGSGAGGSLTSGSNNIYLGAAPVVTSESNTMRLGQINTQTRAFMAGVFGVPVTGSQVFINSSGQLGVSLSSARYKRDIATMGARSHGLFNLRPVTFRYKQDPQRIRQYGLIAEEVAKVYPEIVTRRADGAIESVQYNELIPMLLNELQRQQRDLSAVKAQSARLQAALAEQTSNWKTRSVRLDEAKYTASLASR
jgi:hypothetical protein